MIAKLRTGFRFTINIIYSVLVKAYLIEKDGQSAIRAPQVRSNSKQTHFAHGVIVSTDKKRFMEIQVEVCETNSTVFKGGGKGRLILERRFIHFFNLFIILTKKSQKTINYLLNQQISIKTMEVDRRYTNRLRNTSRFKRLKLVSKQKLILFNSELMKSYLVHADKAIGVQQKYQYKLMSRKQDYDYASPQAIIRKAQKKMIEILQNQLKNRETKRSSTQRLKIRSSLKCYQKINKMNHYLTKSTSMNKMKDRIIQ